MPTLAGTRWVPKNADSRYSTSTGRPSSRAFEVEVRVGRSRADPADQIALGHRVALLDADAGPLEVQVARDQAGGGRVVVDGDVAAHPGGAGLDLDDPPAVRGEHAVAGLALQVDRLVHLVLDVAGQPRVARVLLVGRARRRLLETAAWLAVAEPADVGSLGAELPVLGPQHQRWQQRRHQQQRLGQVHRLEGHGRLNSGPRPCQLSSGRRRRSRSSAAVMARATRVGGMWP
jgi:hypothetical protein